MTMSSFLPVKMSEFVSTVVKFAVCVYKALRKYSPEWTLMHVRSFQFVSVVHTVRFYYNAFISIVFIPGESAI